MSKPSRTDRVILARIVAESVKPTHHRRIGGQIVTQTRLRRVVVARKRATLRQKYAGWESRRWLAPDWHISAALWLFVVALVCNYLHMLSTRR